MARGALAHHLPATWACAAGAAQRLAMLDILHGPGRLFRHMDGAAAEQSATCSEGCQFSEGHTN